MKRDEINITEPCHADWGEMTGDSTRRHCAQCDKSVHNLSDMTEPEAQAVLKQPNVCVRFQASTDGQIRFQSRRRFLVAAAATTITLPAAAAVAPIQDAAPSSLVAAARAVYEFFFGPPACAKPETEPVWENIQGGIMSEPIEIVEPEPELPVKMGEIAPVEMGRIQSIEE